MNDIEARRAGRSRLSTVRDLYSELPGTELVASVERAVTVGDEFAALRELRRRRERGGR